MERRRPPEDEAKTRPDDRRAVVARQRVWLLTIGLAGTAVCLYVLWVRSLEAVDAPFRLPGFVLALGFVAAEVSVLHLQFRRDTHSLSLNEIPLVVGLICVAPTTLLLAQLFGAGSALVFHRRQPTLKLLFNLNMLMLQTCLAILVFHATRATVVEPGPRLWLAANAGSVTAGIASGAAVSLVIWLHQGRRELIQLPKVLGIGLAGALVNSCLALIGLTALWADRSAWVLLSVLGVVVAVAYRTYSSLHQRHASLELLYQFTHVVGRSGDANRIVGDVLVHARELLRAERAELVLVSTGGGDTVRWTSIDGQADPERVQESELHPALRALSQEPEAVIVGKGNREALVRAFLTERGWRDAVFAPLHGEGGVVGVLAVGNRLDDVTSFDSEDGRLFDTIANHASIALQNARLVDRLRYEALHDSLTDLPNRVLFQRRVNEAVARRRARGAPVAVMLMDLDRFKDVNDALGHHTGDALLREVAGRLRRAVGARALVARLGGDEFAVLLSNLEGVEDAVEVAAEIRTELSRPFSHEGMSLAVGATIGIAMAPDHGPDASTLLRRADAAMYAAKSENLGMAVYSQKLDESTPRRLELLAALRQAIERNELELMFQPKAELAGGRVVGVEALVRWNRPGEGYIPPDEFVPLAETSGLIAPLTSYVLGAALRRCREWNDLGVRLSVAVNLSTRSLVDVELVDDIEAALSAHGVDPDQLVVEITETSVMSDPTRTVPILNRLARMGVAVAIDDFGTGYSSLSYLRQLPAQEVKIDKSFVLSMTHDESDAAIVRSIVDLGRNLGLRIVAEGVEDAATWERLRELGCDLAQGYHLSPPLSAEHMTAWLTDGAPRAVGVTISAVA